MRLTGLGNTLAVDVGRRRFAAVWATPSRKGLKVVRAVERQLPSEISSDDPDAIGAWLRQCWREERLPSRPVTMALTRELVGIKRMTLPTTVRDELPEMIRLGLQREAVGGPGSVIDFLTIATDATSTTVLAFAAPEREVESARRIATSADLRLKRLSLRGLGAAALVGQGSGKEGVLVVDFTGEGLEVSVVAGGVLRYSRGVELPSGDDAVMILQTALTEIRRSWLSYRVVQEELPISEAVILGPPRLTSDAVAGVAEIVGGRATVLREHPEVEAAGSLGSAWPLVGMLMGSWRKREMIDFAQPRKAPDVAARRRQRLMLAGGGVTVLLLGSWTMGQKSLRDIRAEVEAQREQWSDLSPRSDRFLRDEYRLEHLRQWTEIKAGWLDHAEHLRGISPGPQLMVLNSWSGSLTAPPFKWTERDGWTAPAELQVRVEGEAKDRLLADQFRAAIIGDKRYSLETTGADKKGGRRYPYPFGYLLKMNIGPRAKPSESKTGGSS